MPQPAGQVASAETSPVQGLGTQQQGEVGQQRRAKRSKPAHGRQLQWELSATALGYRTHDNRKILLTQIEFDLTLQHGQIRRLDDQVVATRVAEMRACPPDAPVRGILLVALDPQSRTYAALGGQHTVRALQLLAEEQRNLGRLLPDHLVHVRATTLEFATPKAICQEWAGNHQFRQGAVASMPISAWCSTYLSLLPEESPPDPACRPQPQSPSQSQSQSSTSRSTAATHQPSSPEEPPQQQSTSNPPAAAAEEVGNEEACADSEMVTNQMALIQHATAITGHRRHPTDVCL